jgi:UDP-N-acetylglucosamine transferase subunit ALG13
MQGERFRMILVLLGTQRLSFARLLAALDESIDKGLIADAVTVQRGHTEYVSAHMHMIDFIQKDEFQRFVEQADLIITHGGVGSILAGVKAGKKVIAVPREKVHGEHVNDHQAQIIEAFDAQGYIKGVFDMRSLEQAILSIGDFTPKPYVSNTAHMIEIIAEFIDAD